MRRHRDPRAVPGLSSEIRRAVPILGENSGLADLRVLALPDALADEVVHNLLDALAQDVADLVDLVGGQDQRR